MVLYILLIYIKIGIHIMHYFLYRQLRINLVDNRTRKLIR